MVSLKKSIKKLWLLNSSTEIIPFERERHYRDQKLNAQYIADFVCYDKIIVELKAISDITDANMAQVRNYLTITGYKLGLLVNFNEMYIEPIRILNSNIKDY